MLKYLMVYWDRLTDSENFYVLYPDGKKSPKMYYTLAKNYANIFGGEVCHVKYDNY